ncbi:MAG: DUF4911 domain-containing protein [Deferribacterales bacterium]
MTRTVKVKCHVDKRNILLVNSLVDSYEGLGIVRTLDSAKGNVVIYSTDTVYKQLLKVLEELNKIGIGVTEIRTEFSEEVDNW